MLSVFFKLEIRTVLCISVLLKRMGARTYSREIKFQTNLIYILILTFGIVSFRALEIKTNMRM